MHIGVYHTDGLIQTQEGRDENIKRGEWDAVKKLEPPRTQGQIPLLVLGLERHRSWSLIPTYAASTAVTCSLEQCDRTCLLQPHLLGLSLNSSMPTRHGITQCPHSFNTESGAEGGGQLISYLMTNRRQDINSSLLSEEVL